MGVGLDVKFTQHAKIRSYQRYRLNEKALDRLVRKSIDEGFGIKDAPHKRLRFFLEKKATETAKPYCYGGYIFILRFYDDYVLLITTYRMPKRYLKYV